MNEVNVMTCRLLNDMSDFLLSTEFSSAPMNLLFTTVFLISVCTRGLILYSGVLYIYVYNSDSSSAGSCGTGQAAFLAKNEQSCCREEKWNGLEWHVSSHWCWICLSGPNIHRSNSGACNPHLWAADRKKVIQFQHLKQHKVGGR